MTNPIGRACAWVALGVAWLTSASACRVNVPALECTRPEHCGSGETCFQGRCVPAGDTGQDADAATDLTGDPTDTSDATDVADEDGDGPIVWPNDPAPGRDRPQEYPCDGGPQADLNDSTFIIIDGTAHDYHRFTGTVQGASGNGTWYVRDGDGREQLGTVVTDPRTGSFDIPVPTWCDTSLVKLLWHNETCDYLTVFSVQTASCVDTDLQVTLFWNQAGDNLDLHLVRPGGHLNDPQDDCNSWTCIGQAPDWGAPGTADDPRKSLDLDHGGPEGIFLNSPQDGQFNVFVERQPSVDVSTADFDAIVIATVGGRPTASQILAIPSRSVWSAATVDWPEATVTPSTKVTDCSGDWGDHGCMLVMPE